MRRLNRAEYANAIRDLLHVEVDSTALLPPDDSAYGFDNIADALDTSPAHVEQYLSAAGKIAALAVGDPDTGPAAQTFRIRQDASQDIPVVGMPLGTVGGGMARVVLPLDGEYRLDVTYFKSNLGAMKGLELPHEFEIAVDGERVHLTTIGGPEDFTALMRNITEAADAVGQTQLDHRAVDRRCARHQRRVRLQRRAARHHAAAAVPAKLARHPRRDGAPAHRDADRHGALQRDGSREPPRRGEDLRVSAGARW